MTKDIILVSSGFILPANRLFEQIKKEVSYRESLLENHSPTKRNHTLGRLVASGELFGSSVCNDAYIEFLREANFDNTIKLVDILADVFKDISLSSWLETQARNPFLTPLGFKLCEDIVNDKLYKTYNDYLIVPSVSKLGTGVDLTDEEINRRLKIVNGAKNNTFRDLFSWYMTNPGMLSAFFKYVMTDSNRAKTYG